MSENDDLRGVEGIQKAARVYAEAERQRLFPFESISQELKKMYESILGPREQLERALRAAVGPLDSLRHFQTQVLAINQLEELQKSVRAFESRFRLPAFTEIETILGVHRSTIAQLHHSLGKMTTPWLDTANAIRSVHAMAQLQDLAKCAATVLTPFSEDLTAKLRASLGDWRIPVVFPASITDPIVRLEFYESRGFNSHLTDFPGPAFSEALATSGLPPIRLAEEDLPPGTTEEDLERNSEAYIILLCLERRIRRFIAAKLEGVVGKGWIKQRIPGDMLQEWKKKKDDAVKRGEPTQRELIDYADFSDYVDIIVRKDNWRDAFCQVFERAESVTESLTRLQPVRIATMHSRILTQDDELFLLAEVRRLERAIGEVQ